MINSAHKRPKDFFDEFGYFIEDDVYSYKDMEEIFYNFYDICLSFVLKNKIDNTFPDTSSLSYPDDLKMLDKIVMKIFLTDTKLLGEVYDAFSYSLVFFRFLSNRKIESITHELLGMVSKKALYGWTNRMRIDPPKDERRTYGWHQEIFYTIPNTRFLQTWCPMLRDTTISNGTIEIKKGSHKEGIAKQSWNEIEGRATQIIIDKGITDRYETIQLEMKVGQVLFFDGHLAHRSGHNSTKGEIRFSLVGMWNDISYEGFRAAQPSFQSRTISAKEYFNQKMKNEK